MTNDEIKQLAYAQDHGSAKEWCFTGESLLAFARALESRVLAETSALEQRLKIANDCCDRPMQACSDAGCPDGVRMDDWIRANVRVLAERKPIKPYEQHDPDNATEPFLSFIPDAKRDELIGALLASLERNADRETDFYTVRWFIGGLGLLAAQFAPKDSK
jgi:hypothetical protein